MTAIPPGAPVVLTGASGFLAKHVAQALLREGHAVRGTLRSPAREDEVRAAVLPGLPPGAGDRLGFVALDLTRDEGWAEALAGASALVHTASPFPLEQPRDPEEVIRPAVEGTRRALTAAARAGVRRVVLTSSTEAVETAKAAPHTEADWADPDAPRPYTRSKILAERAAWDLAGAEGLALTVINPSMILGPLLDDRVGTSAGLVARILRGRDPMQPDLSFGVVDARDVARLHAEALGTPGSEGRRVLAVAGTLSFVAMARALAAAFPDRRIRARQAPSLVVRAMSLVAPELRQVSHQLGRRPLFDAALARSLFGRGFIAPEEALLATARSLVERGLA